MVLSEQQLRERQRELTDTTQAVLNLDEGSAAHLLRYCNWLVLSLAAGCLAVVAVLPVQTVLLIAGIRIEHKKNGLAMQAACRRRQACLIINPA